MVWQTKKLGDLCQLFTDGDWIETKDQSSSGVRLVQTGNIGIGEFKDRSDKARFISEDTFSRLRCTEIFPGDCLVSRLPDPVGRACVIPENDSKMITAVDCTIIRFKNNTVTPDFFNYFSQSVDYLSGVDARTSGATRKRISRKNLGQVVVPVPPLKEQKQIVTILDEAFDKIDHARQLAERNLNNARQLFDSTLNQIFTQRGDDWRELILSDVCRINSTLIQPTEPEYVDMYHVGAANIVTNSTQLIDIKTAREEGLKSGKYIFDANVVLYSKIRPYLKKVSIPDFDGLCSADIYPLTIDSNVITRKFLFFLLLTEDFTKYAIAGSARAGMPKVNRKHLFSYSFSLPSISEQERIIAILDHISVSTRTLEKIYQQKITDLGELKQSLLQKAFRGELTSKDIKAA